MNAKCQIIGIEKDRKLAEELKRRFRENKYIKIIEGDALKVLPSIIHNSSFIIHHWKLVGNIPYYITGHLFRIISELQTKPELSVFLIQKEVAERIIAKPPRMNLLAASVQIWAEPKIISAVPPGVFSPPPKVQSAIIKLITKSHTLNTKSYFEILHILFKQPRKTILNNLADGLSKNKLDIVSKLENIGIKPKDRPQNLEISEIVKIAELY